MSAAELVQQKRPEILRIAAKHGARNVRLFGSVVRGEDDEKSDIDLLVELAAGRTLLDHAALILELQALLGRKVDVASERGPRPAVRQRILSEVTPL